MGADLYINDKEGNEVAYFRDSYNRYSLLLQNDLSWWVDISKLIDKETGKMSVENCKKFVELLNDKKFSYNDRISLMTKENQEYFDSQRVKLIGFLNKAIESNRPVLCSI